MANIVHGGINDFDALIYGPKHPNVIAYLENQLVNYSPTLTGAAQDFFADSRRLYDEFNSAAAIRAATAAIKKVSHVIRMDVIQILSTVTELQNAQFQMQRWIMANPVVRKAYHNQQCDGYSGQYVDLQPGVVGEQHYDYRRVMDGVLQETPNTDSDWKITHYIDDLHEGDRKLTLPEKIDVLSTWDFIEAAMERKKEDPTNLEGGAL
jgi:hypothetical protein